MPASRCPICDKPSEPDYRPFCSRRCADLDLQRWFSGRYVIPGPPSEEGGRGGAAEADEDS